MRPAYHRNILANIQRFYAFIRQVQIDCPYFVGLIQSDKGAGKSILLISRNCYT